MYDNTGHLSLDTRPYASMFAVEFHNEMSAAVGVERRKKVSLKNMEAGGV